MAVNLVVYQGNLGQEPKEFTTRTGERCCVLNIANNTAYEGDGGERKEATTWAGVACYKRVADYVLDVLKPQKGDELLVEGKLNSYSQNDRGQRRAVLQVKATSVRITKKSNDRPEKHYADAETSAGRGGGWQDDEIPF